MLLADALTAAVHGVGPKFILVEMPPRAGKSEMVSHWFPVWALEQDPRKRIILSSYEADFARDWGRKVRNTIQSNQELLRVRISKDSAAANRWNTTAGGGMITAGAGGAITGRGGEILIVDDALKNSQDAASPTIRNTIWDWWRSTLFTRRQPGAVVVVIGTRWHEDDLIGRLVKQQEEGDPDALPWLRIRFPAIAEGVDVLGREPGEALWPEMYPVEELARIRASLGEYFWSALYQQRPAPMGGMVWLREWWDADNRRYGIDDPYAVNRTVGRFISWDTALKDKTDSDYSAATVFDLLPDYRVAVREVFRAKLPFPSLPDTILSLARKWNFDEKLRAIIIEDKASGTSALQTLHSSAPDLRNLLKAYNPTSDKWTRANQAAVWAANGSVLLPKPSESCPWLFDFETELFGFPTAAHDDMADAFAQGLLWLEHLLAAGLDARNGVRPAESR